MTRDERSEIAESLDAITRKFRELGSELEKLQDRFGELASNNAEVHEQTEKVRFLKRYS